MSLSPDNISAMSRETMLADWHRLTAKVEWLTRMTNDCRARLLALRRGLLYQDARGKLMCRECDKNWDDTNLEAHRTCPIVGVVRAQAALEDAG